MRVYVCVYMCARACESISQGQEHREAESFRRYLLGVAVDHSWNKRVARGIVLEDIPVRHF